MKNKDKKYSFLIKTAIMLRIMSILMTVILIVLACMLIIDTINKLKIEAAGFLILLDPNIRDSVVEESGDDTDADINNDYTYKDDSLNDDKNNENSNITDGTEEDSDIDNNEISDTGFVHFANFENLGKQNSGWVTITSQFGWRELIGVRDFHRGVDIRTGYGNDDGSGKNGHFVMYTVADNATILEAETYETEKYGRGTTVLYMFERNGVYYRIRYCHLDRFLIDGLKVGDVIEKKGTPIAVSGNTGGDTRVLANGVVTGSTGYHIHVDLQVSTDGGKTWKWAHPMILYGYDNTRDWFYDNNIMFSHTSQCTDEYIEYNINPSLRTDVSPSNTGYNEVINVYKCSSCYGG